jgi:hypothetical protein
MLTNVARRTTGGSLLLLILATSGAVLIAKQEFAPALHVEWESDGLKISSHPAEVTVTDGTAHRMAISPSLASKPVTSLGAENVRTKGASC